MTMADFFNSLVQVSGSPIVLRQDRRRFLEHSHRFPNVKLSSWSVRQTEGTSGTAVTTVFVQGQNTVWCYVKM